MVCSSVWKADSDLHSAEAVMSSEHERGRRLRKKDLTSADHFLKENHSDDVRSIRQSYRKAEKTVEDPPKKKPDPIIINGVDVTIVTREKLEEFVHLLREEMEREREERNYFQLERDKLQTLWQITREQLEENRARLRNKERDMEESEEKHREQVQHIKQRVKHLLYLQECDLKDLEAVLNASLEEAQREYHEVQKELLLEKKELKARLLEQELANQEEIRILLLEQEDELRRTSGIHFERLRKMEAEYEKTLAIQKENLRIRHEMELAEVAERKHEHVLQLKENHTRDFSEVNDYYNTVVLKNLSLIKSIKVTT